MADTGFKNPSATGEDYTGWSGTNLGAADAYTDNAEYAYPNAPNNEQDYYNFSFGVPSGATIDGIEVHVNYTGFGIGSTAAIAVALSHNGGTNYTAEKTDSTLINGPSEDNVTFGGSTDTWGRSWTDTEFSNTNFRLRIADNNGFDQPYVDHIEVKVYYTEVSARRIFNIS